ncbi:MAG: hypothetical protein MZV70_19530 [Desulfobacterales bacterium]|nr:hypothetical protein [Desulfobacterales bacterium]
MSPALRLGRFAASLRAPRAKSRGEPWAVGRRPGVLFCFPVAAAIGAPDAPPCDPRGEVAERLKAAVC